MGGEGSSGSSQCYCYTFHREIIPSFQQRTLALRTNNAMAEKPFIKIQRTEVTLMIQFSVEWQEVLGLSQT